MQTWVGEIRPREEELKGRCMYKSGRKPPITYRPDTFAQCSTHQGLERGKFMRSAPVWSNS